MPIIPPPPVEKAHLPNTVTSQSVSSPSRGSTRRKWIYYERIGELKELSKDEEHFSSSIDKLYNFCSKKDLSEDTKAKAIELIDRLCAGCSHNSCELERRIELLNIIKDKIEKLPDSEKKDFANQIFSLFLLDHQARLKMNNRQFAEAEEDLKKLANLAEEKFIPYYTDMIRRWALPYCNVCYLLHKKSLGTQVSDLIRYDSYISLDDFTKDDISFNYPEFKALRDLEKSQVRPRESEESEGSRDAKRKRVEDTAEKS